MEHPARSLHNLREMLLRLALELNSSCHFRQSRKSQRFAVAPSLSDCSFWLLLEVLLFSTAELCFRDCRLDTRFGVDDSSGRSTLAGCSQNVSIGRWSLCQR